MAELLRNAMNVNVQHRCVNAGAGLAEYILPSALREALNIVLYPI